MNMKLVLGLVALPLLMVPASAIVVPTDFPLEYLLPADFTCENNAHTTSFLDPTSGEMVHVHIQCPAPLGFEASTALDTDCTGTSWSHWVGPAAQAWTYTHDTTNPYGFSQTAVNSAWAASSTVWEAATVPATNIYSGFVNGGTSANSGVFDEYILAEFRYLSGQLRTAVGVQWAWGSGQITHTDAAYNTRYAFSLTGAPNTYDLQSIASHEMGHGYGLGHSNTASSSSCLTLYPYATLGATHGRTLGDGDLTSIANRY